MLLGREPSRAAKLLLGAAARAGSCWSSWTATRRQSGGRTSTPIWKSQSCKSKRRSEMTACLTGQKNDNSCKMKHGRAEWPFSLPTCRLGCGRRSRIHGEPLVLRHPELWCSPPGWTTAQSYPRHHYRQAGNKPSVSPIKPLFNITENKSGLDSCYPEIQED